MFSRVKHEVSIVNIARVVHKLVDMCAMHIFKVAGSMWTFSWLVTLDWAPSRRECYLPSKLNIA